MVHDSSGVVLSLLTAEISELDPHTLATSSTETPRAIKHSGSRRDLVEGELTNRVAEFDVPLG
ncbi:MAG: hypothetical protein ACJAY5_000065 [Actinomycetes bacterium]